MFLRTQSSDLSFSSEDKDFSSRSSESEWVRRQEQEKIRSKKHTKKHTCESWGHPLHRLSGGGFEKTVWSSGGDLGVLLVIDFLEVEMTFWEFIFGRWPIEV